MRVSDAAEQRWARRERFRESSLNCSYLSASSGSLRVSLSEEPCTFALFSPTAKGAPAMTSRLWLGIVSSVSLFALLLLDPQIPADDLAPPKGVEVIRRNLWIQQQ